MTYADDLVILCRKGNADEALQQLRKIMSKLKLTVNEEKTRICKVPEGEFDFLGDTFGPMHSARTGQARLGYRPSKKSIKRMVETSRADRPIGDLARDHRNGAEVKPHATRMGERLRSGLLTKAYRAIDNYTAMRLRRWLRIKPRSGDARAGPSTLALYGHFGLHA